MPLDTMPKAYLFLVFAILTETVATTALKVSDGFTRIGPAIVVVLGYGASFYLLALALRTIPIGIAYALWSGLGVVFIAMIGHFVFRQTLDWAGVVGIGLIIAGIVVMQVLSKSA